MRIRASFDVFKLISRSACIGSALAAMLLTGGVAYASLDDGPEQLETERAATMSEAELTAKAYRAVFDRLPTDLEPLEHVPSGRGLDSWKLFAEHPELAPLADALVAISERESCDFALVEKLEPSVEHHQPYNRAKNLLLHRVVTKLHGDRMQQPDDFGRLPEPVGVDEGDAKRYAIAMLNMAMHFGERGTLAERRIAANAAPDLMGVARRAPQGLPWALDTIRASRSLEPIENLFDFQAATISRLQLLASMIKEQPEQYITAFGLMPSDGNTSTPLFAATLERHRWAYSHAAETLGAEWDLENPLPEVLAVLRAIPSDLTVPRSTIGEITRGVSELAAVREDVRVMLKAYPADDSGKPDKDTADKDATDGDKEADVPDANNSDD